MSIQRGGRRRLLLVAGFLFTSLLVALAALLFTGFLIAGFLVASLLVAGFLVVFLAVTGLLAASLFFLLLFLGSLCHCADTEREHTNEEEALDYIEFHRDNIFDDLRYELSVSATKVFLFAQITKQTTDELRFFEFYMQV